MDRNAKIIVTGAAGFIGSCLVGLLNQRGYEQLILVDQFDDAEKESEPGRQKKFMAQIERDQLFEWLESRNEK